MNPRVWCFDLEMNQPSGKIIQVGGVIGDLHKGQILTTFSYYINPEETLNPEIITLTGITQAQVDQGFALDQITREIEALIAKYHACKSPVVWGNGDLRQLKTQGGGQWFQGIYREIDIKTVHQLYNLSCGFTMRGGLEKALLGHGIKFEGRPHNALDDAINTFRIACFFQKMFKSIDVAKFSP